MADLEAKLVANADRGDHQLWQIMHEDLIVGHAMWGEQAEQYEFVSIQAKHFTADELARVAGFVRELNMNEAERHGDSIR